MADVSKIKTIDNNTYDIKDAAAREALDTKQPLITTENKVPYSLISGTPTIPTKTSQLTNNSGFLTSHQDISGKANLSGATFTGNVAINGPTTAGLTVSTGGAKISGRYNGSGDDEGLIVGLANNGFAGCILGNPSGERTIMYHNSTNHKGWIRRNNGSTQANMYFPDKDGTFAMTSDIPDVSGKANINGINTFSKPQKIVGKDSDDGSSQSALLKVLNTQTSTTGTTEWRGRIMCGAENKTFLLGTYNGLCGLGAHSWTSAASGTGASWEPVYIQPDGTQPVYIGANGVGWTSGSGALKVTGSNTAGAATVDVNGTLRINGSNVADYVVEQGVSSGWQYKKWNSGRAECWGVTAESCAITVSQGNCYRTNGIVLNLAFPFTFKSTPKCYVTLSGANTGLWVSGLPSLSTTATGGVFVFRPSSGTYTVTANYYAEGSWK